MINGAHVLPTILYTAVNTHDSLNGPKQDLRFSSMTESLLWVTFHCLYYRAFEMNETLGSQTRDVVRCQQMVFTVRLSLH